MSGAGRFGRFSAVRARVGHVGECGGEEAVSPVFGEAAGVGKDEVDFGVAHLEPGELVSKPVPVDVLQLVQAEYLASTTTTARGSSESRCI